MKKMILLRRVDKINITIVEIKRKVYTIDYCKENQFMDAYKIGKLIAKKKRTSFNSTGFS